MSRPIRVQRKRVKGYRMPENTVSVCRPGKWGNPFRPNPGNGEKANAGAVSAYRAWLNREYSPIGIPRPPSVSSIISGLRGKNLACFCPLDSPCHADVLLEIANPTFQP